MNLLQPARRYAALFGLATLFLAGCEQAPPPPNPAAMEQELKQLDEHRQQEWGGAKPP